MYEAPIAYILNGLAAAASTSPAGGQTAATTYSSKDETPIEEWE